MTLENYIYESIYCYPILHYYSDFQKSRMTVLCHLFLTNGNGMDFNKKGFMVSNSRYGERRRNLKISEIKRRLKAGERIVNIYDKKTFGERTTGFVIDVGIGDVDTDKFAVRYFPDDNEMEYIYTSKAEHFPYPFCFYFLPFVEINPHYGKYTYHTIKDMTVGELKESIPLIRKDWLAGIVETFQWALDFYESEKFDNDTYYNWTTAYDFQNWIKKFNENPKRLEDYQIPSEMADKSAEDIAKFLVNRNRMEYVNNCKKVLEAFS